MATLQNKIDFALLISVTNANPNDVYLMGYYLQRKELNTYKQEDE